MTAPPDSQLETSGSSPSNPWEVLKVSLRLGLTSFGGPIAHLGYFERAYVNRHRWLSGAEFGSLVALCQMLPGPASSQLGFLIGLRRAGWPGAVAAWLGFTLPSAFLMYVAAIGASLGQGPYFQSMLQGLKLVAVAVVAQAVWSMARRLCPDRPRAAIAVGAAAVLLLAGGPASQFLVLLGGAFAGLILCRGLPPDGHRLRLPIRSRTAWTALALFGTLLVALPVLDRLSPHSYIALAGISYRAGALVFGGGHVVLPLLRDSLVPTGWISDDRFLEGYGLAQALPGPLFTLGTFLGAANSHVSSPLWGATVASIFIFLPGLLLAIAGGALWDSIARHASLRAGLAGINAAVVGILGAALYEPVGTAALHDGFDVAIAVVALALLERWKAPPVAVVLFCMGAGLAHP